MTDATRPDLDAIRQRLRRSGAGEPLLADIDAYVAAITAERDAIRQQIADHYIAFEASNTHVGVLQAQLAEAHVSIQILEGSLVRAEATVTALTAERDGTVAELRRQLGNSQLNHTESASRETELRRLLALCEQARDNVLSSPMAAGLLLELKAECEAQHTRADAAEAQVRHLTQQLQTYEQYCRPVDLEAARRALVGVSAPAEET